MSHAGRLSLFINRWRLITSDAVLLSWVKGYKLPFNTRILQGHTPSSLCINKSDLKAYREVIDDLLKIGAISPCQSCYGEYISSTFLVPKPDGRLRFILNLKSLNRSINTKHFKLEDLRTTLKLISNNYYLATLDLKDAYFLIPINKSDRKFLRFRDVDNTLYEFNVLPFGLCTAPYVFTKLLKPVMALLRRLGYISTIYLDDICCIGKTYKECQKNVQITKLIFESLGFVINNEKSSLTPSTSCKYLGFIINTELYHIRLTDTKKTYVTNEIIKFMAFRRCKIRCLAHLVGLLVSACPAVQYGWLYTKELERCKYLQLLKSNNNYDSYMNVPLHIHQDLLWWLNAIKNNVNPIRDERYLLEIFSDASKTGWGVACGEETANGRWGETEKDLHINLLELMAAFFGLKIFAKQLKNCQILLRIDNTTAISYVNRMGGIRFPHLNKITKELWQWCEEKNIHVFASYVSSKNNEIADAESRTTHPDIEWELSNDAFSNIVKMFSTPTIDLFASRLNKKCDLYVSWKRDPDAYAVNAFTLNWSNLNFYAFPPFAVILKTLRKIITDEAAGIVVVPYWPTQPWFPLFESLLVSKIILFEPSDEALLSSSHRPPPPRLTLAAGRLSGRHY